MEELKDEGLGGEHDVETRGRGVDVNPYSEDLVILQALDVLRICRVNLLKIIGPISR